MHRGWAPGGAGGAEGLFIAESWPIQHGAQTRELGGKEKKNQAFFARKLVYKLFFRKEISLLRTALLKWVAL